MTNPIMIKSRVVEIRNTVNSRALTTGHFASVQDAEPLSAARLDGGLTLACWVNRMTIIPGRGLSGAGARLEIFLRSYQGALTDYRDDIDPTQLAGMAELFGVFVGGFTLDGYASFVDLKGQYGEPLDAPSGHLTLDRKIFRTYDLIIPLIVDDLWVEAR